jgi:hypothetical protein
MGERIEINSSKSQIEDFKDSIIWKDITTELEAWIEGFRREQDSIVEDAANSNPSTASVLLHLGDLNGRRKAILYVLGIPDLFIELLESRAKDKNRPE